MKILYFAKKLPVESESRYEQVLLTDVEKELLGYMYQQRMKMIIGLFVM